MSTLEAVSRREFLRLCGVAGAGLVIGARIGEAETAAIGTGRSGDFVPNAWIAIDRAGTVTIVVSRTEMGQGARTAMPMLVAEELEADWRRIRIEPGRLDPRYGSQLTAGSSSVRGGWDPLRKAGAAAREMLIAAAAAQWKVAPASCRAREGQVIHEPSGRRAGYGDLVERAAKFPVPQEPPLKDPQDYRLIGTRLPRLDVPAKVDGVARFGLDQRLPGMLRAAIVHPPVFGAGLVSVNDARARQVPGVRDVVKLRRSVAVVADDTWAAFEGGRALEVTWDEGAHAGLDSAAIERQLEEAARGTGAVARTVGSAPHTIAHAARTLEADYHVPYLWHAMMEPPNCVADARGGRCEIWAPTQFPNPIRDAVAGQLGIEPGAVQVNITLAGCGLGRRTEPDVAVEAAAVSKAVNAPVQVVWSREDDLHHDSFRPASLHRLRAGLDGGKLVALSHRIATQSISAQHDPESVQDGYDRGAVDGAANIAYAIPHLLVDLALIRTPVPVGYWRSVYAGQNAFAVECFLDEVAAALGQDPVALRRELLSGSPRHRAVVELAAAKAGWGTPLPGGHGRGIALCECFGSIVAEVAEVSRAETGVPRVHRVTCAVDCGVAVHPGMIEQQFESAIACALTALLKGPVTIARGRVRENNFDAHDLVRMGEMPEVAVHIVPSRERPGGIGEPGVPPLAPAVANAFYAVTGRRIRRLPVEAGV